MNTKKILISNIKPNPKNPKKHDLERITNSVKEFGYVEPIVVDENNVILAGHGRLEALKELKEKEVEVIVKKGLTQKQKDKYLLLSNKLVERGGWDEDLLAGFDEVELLDVGFESEELMEIFSLNNAESVEVDEGSLMVIMVEPPEAPRLKERLAFYCDTIEEYNSIREFFKKGKSDLDKDKLLNLI